MGAVYEATPLNRSDLRIALKILHAEMASMPAVVERFLAEGEVCRRLDHPGILRVHEIGSDLLAPYLVMDLLEGRPLSDWTANLQRLPLTFAVTICAGVLQALDYAHAHSVVHRDLKPENVFLTSSPGGLYKTKLLDFGIAKCIDEAGGARRRTATGVLLGTPGYMSPEQVKGAKSVDHRSDLWAVGVMFYEMVAGAIAFPPDGDDPTNIWGLISAVLIKEPVDLAVYDPQLAPFDAFIRRALSKDAAGRYASAREMSDDLLRIAGSCTHPFDPHSVGANSIARDNALFQVNSQGELPWIPSVHPSKHGESVTPKPGFGTLASGRSSDENRIALDPAFSATVPAHDHGPPRSDARAKTNLALAPASSVAPPAMASAPLAPLHGTAPSGFALPPGAFAQGAVVARDLQDGSDQDGRSGNLVGWIVLGCALIAALGGAIYWVAN
ncbi:MAG: hypothetical protein NVSMB1_01690 [Polyangiales bacterium]